MKLEVLKKKLEIMIDSLSVNQIIAAWTDTEKNYNAETSPIVRGAIMDRMERENSEKYWSWINSSDDPKIEEFYRA